MQHDGAVHLRRSTRWALIATLSLGLPALLAISRKAEADVQADDRADFNARCAIRLSVTLLGQSPTPELSSSVNPQGAVATMVSSPEFVERFARFINASFNREPAEAAQLEPAYYLTRHVLTDDKPWSDMFLGKYNVDVVGDQGVQVTEDENGLGYFRSTPWLVRYAGNELAGVKIVTAYRILQNMVGLELVASTNAPDADVSATGREAAGCKGCHYENWYALDKVASILSARVVDPEEAQVTPFKPYEGPAKTLLGGASIAGDAELVAALAQSENFTFNACRLAFKFLYGRAENKCEGPIFDACVSAFRATGKMQSAITAIATNEAFCQ